MQDTINEIQAHDHAVVTTATFGHLAPIPRKYYAGFILFTLSEFGDTSIVAFSFNGLPNSPWLCEDILNHITKYTDKLPDTEHYGVYQWRGSYMKFKNGNSSFQGKFAKHYIQLH